MANLRIKLVKSLSGRHDKHIATAYSLGLHKIGNETVQPDNPQTRCCTQPAVSEIPSGSAAAIILLAVFIFGSSCSVCIFCAQAQSDNSKTGAINSANTRLGVIFVAAPFRISRFGRNRRRRIRCDCFRRWRSCARSFCWRSSYG